MALRNILKGSNNDRLRKVSKEVKEIDNRIIQLLDDMHETLKKAEGVGLAAPQIGVLRRVAVIHIEDEVIELINPVIIEEFGEQFEEEGCLSLPNRWGKVVRPAKVVVEAFNREGDLMQYEAEDLLCRAFCHEIDHLNGVLFADIMLEEVHK